MDLVQANGLVGASVLGTVENASFQGPDAASEAPHSAPPSPGFYAVYLNYWYKSTNTDASLLANSPPAAHATYVFNWRVTRHVRTIGMYLVCSRHVLVIY